MSVAQLVGKAKNGDRLALTRLLTIVENNTPERLNALEMLFPSTGTAHCIGITGAPGTGKSTLTSKLALAFRETGQKVAILAVDPSSPFSGGALLGDRIRMRELSGDPDIFIRSMASRGHLGGVARSTYQVASVFDAVGFDIILIETVGAGQGEVEIASMAHTTVVVEAPGLGDEIQANKAGILEIADILVINKADLPGAVKTEQALRSVFAVNGAPIYKHMRDIDLLHPDEDTQESQGWKTPICKTTATDNMGVAELKQIILEHADFLKRNGVWEKIRQQQYQTHFYAALGEALLEQWKEHLSPGQKKTLMGQLNEQSTHPAILANQWLSREEK
jgi:LAO/AO transport system kinase